MNRPTRTTLLAMALLAGAIMLFEIALTRIFSFTIWHHFTFMVISVALLGFAVSGVALQIRPALAQPMRGRAALYSGLFAVAAVLAVAAVVRVPFNPNLLGREPAHLLVLGLYYVILLIPFTFAGLAIATLLQGSGESANRVYASDLIGAGACSLLVVPSLGWLGAEGVIVGTAALGFGSALLLSSGAGPRRWPLWLALTLLTAFAVPWSSELISIPPGPSKKLSQMLDQRRFPDARVLHTEWNALSRVDVVERTMSIPWIRNPNVRLPVPEQTLLVIDGDAGTPMIRNEGGEDLRSLDHALASAGLATFRPERALIIGAGGGADVLSALRHGASHVDAIEINPIITGLVTGRFAPYTGHLFERAEVDLHLAEGRSFVRRSEDQYDLVQLSLIDTWAASAAGAYSLSESYLYTVEAFRDYLGHLTDRGVLMVTRPLGEPPRETLKLCTVAAAALKELGVAEPGEHVVVLALAGLGNVVVKRTPFTPEEIAALREIASREKFRLMYAPGDDSGNAFDSFFGAEDPSRFFSEYRFDVTPATDDSPFFFQFGRWTDLWGLFSAAQGPRPVFAGRLVLLAALAQAAVLSLLLLILPLVVRRNRTKTAESPHAGRPVWYFFLLGISFMLLEIGMMQRYTLFLGHPVYAISVVLAVLLVAAGLGSMYAGSIQAMGRARFVFVGIVLLSLVQAFLLPPLFQAALGLPLAARIALGVLALAPLGFLLGVPFPAALNRLALTEKEPQVGWAWAANGCGSVLGPMAAVLIAMETGLTTVILIAAVGYGIAFVTSRPIWATGRS